MAVQNGKELNHKEWKERWYCKSTGEGKRTSAIKAAAVKL